MKPTIEQEPELLEANQQSTGMGELLKTHIRESDFDEPELGHKAVFNNRFRPNSNTADALTRASRQIDSRESVLDGFDLIAMAVDGVAAVLRVKEMLAQGTSLPSTNTNNNEERDDVSQQLSQMSDRIIAIEPQLYGTSPMPQLPPVKNNKANLALAAFVLDQKTQQYERQLNLIEDHRSSESKEPNWREYDRHFAGLQTIKAKISEIEKRLDTVQETIDRKQKKSVDPEKTYVSLKNYLDAVTELRQEFLENSERQIFTKTLGKIDLKDKGEKAINIERGGTTLYRAKTKNNSWKIETNKLSLDEIQRIERLPQNKSEVITEYSGRQLANFLAQKLVREQKERKIVKWQHQENNREGATYILAIEKIDSQNKTSIRGTNSKDENVFNAEVSQDGLIEVNKNKIPLKHIEKLLEGQSIEQTKQLSQVSQNAPQPQSQSKTKSLRLRL
ncbi:hypothetical protein [Myxosarcina sp. GI1]|uniref:hypothetical protein n=1 Tax=Myxosarcina sp. GI1 TaxID=1541065 RepID=UPI00056149F7|nr:hypothetical protein [Myxosarcina sp. GI1]